MTIDRRLYRSETDRKIAGVCGGLAEFLGIDATIVRVVFIILAISGVGVILYPAMWIVVPTRSALPPLPEVQLPGVQGGALADGEASGTTRGRRSA